MIIIFCITIIIIIIIILCYYINIRFGLKHSLTICFNDTFCEKGNRANFLIILTNVGNVPWVSSNIHWLIKKSGTTATTV